MSAKPLSTAYARPITTGISAVVLLHHCEPRADINWVCMTIPRLRPSVHLVPSGQTFDPGRFAGQC
jgi:hypothetical protein